MANLKAIRIRIGSVRSTRQITSAMKMVSAAKLRRAQDKIVQLKPYVSKLQEILADLTQSLGEKDVENVFARNIEPENPAYRHNFQQRPFAVLSMQMLSKKQDGLLQKNIPTSITRVM